MMKQNHEVSNVPEGYKQTEVGVIPEDWDAIKIESIANIQRGASPRPIDSPIWFDRNSAIGWLRISDVSNTKKYLTETVQNLSSRGIEKSRFVESDKLVMSICATVGKPIITRKDLCIHDGFVVFHSLKINQEYAYYFLEKLEPDWGKLGQTGSQMNLNTNLINSTYIFIPQNKQEQTAIANALSDVDALIAELERLIAKKEAIKTGAMQQLLTGRTRLPQFAKREDGTPKGYKTSELGEIPEDWKIIKLGSVSSFINGRAYALHEWENTGIPVIRLQNLTGRGEEYYYSNLSLPEKNYCHNGDLLFMWSATFGPIIWKGKKAIYHYHIWKIECEKDCNKKYLYYLLSDLTEKLKRGSSSGGTMLHITKKVMEETEAIFPLIKEQIAIAEILSDMDSELEALEKRLDKTKALKQGMMQELLTGRTRLV